MMGKRFFAESVLRGKQDGTSGSDWTIPLTNLGRLGRDILKFKRNNVDASSKLGNPIEIVIVGANFEIGDLASRCVGIG